MLDSAEVILVSTDAILVSNCVISVCAVEMLDSAEVILVSTDAILESSSLILTSETPILSRIFTISTFEVSRIAVANSLSVFNIVGAPSTSADTLVSTYCLLAISALVEGVYVLVILFEPISSVPVIVPPERLSLPDSTAAILVSRLSIPDCKPNCEPFQYKLLPTR